MRTVPPAVWAIVLGAFAMGADQFILAGLVQQTAAARGAPLDAVGDLAGVSALGVAIGAPVFAAAGTRLGRRPSVSTSVGR